MNKSSCFYLYIDFNPGQNMKLCENSIAIFLTVICMEVSFKYVQGKNCNNLNVIPRGNL